MACVFGCGKKNPAVIFLEKYSSCLLKQSIASDSYREVSKGILFLIKVLKIDSILVL
jgi:hypothetical protein